MKISGIRVYQATKPFNFLFQSGQASRTSSESLILQLEYENGMYSFGESAPRAYVTGETLTSAANLIWGSFAPILLHRNIENLEDVESALRDIEDLCLHKNLNPYNSALGAVDIALLDALGKLEEKPIAAYLGPPIGRSIPYSVSVPFLPPERVRQLFHRFRHYPIKHVKVLVGEDLSQNTRRLALIRSLFGEEAEIRIEANGKWSFEQALANLKELQRFRICAVEQPLPSKDIEGLRELRKETGIPVVADESFCTLSDAKRVIDREACDILNIKVSKCGGLLRSKAIADFAHSSRVPCQLGAHVGETEILTRAGRHFAATTDLRWFEGGYAFLLFGDKRVDETGTASGRLSGAGLGLKPSIVKTENQHWEKILPSSVRLEPP